MTDGQRAVPFDLSVTGANVVIKIGDPNKLVSGANRYVIRYTVQGAMNRFDDHDELFWNVDGDQWPVPKQSVTATVIVPAGSSPEAVCYEGVTDSREPCAITPSENQITYASTRQLDSGEQLSVVAGLTRGVVDVPPPMLTARDREFPRTPSTSTR